MAAIYDARTNPIACRAIIDDIRREISGGISIMIERKPPASARRSEAALATGAALYPAFRQYVPLDAPLTAQAVAAILPREGDNPGLAWWWNRRLCRNLPREARGAHLRHLHMLTSPAVVLVL